MAHPNTGVPVAISGTATAIAHRVYIHNPRGAEAFARQIEIRNDAAPGADNLRVSFGGTAYISLGPGEVRTWTAILSWFDVVSSGVGAVVFSAVASVS